MFKAQVLGKLQLQNAETVSTSFPTRHVEELLGYLLLNQQVAHTREKLVTLLWPDCTLHRARPRFSTVFWRLRALFSAIDLRPDELFHTTREWIAFRPRAAPDVDVMSFQRYLSQADLATDLTERAQLLGKALQLYRGELLEGIYAEWCLVEREQLARLRLRALGQLMSCYMEQHDYQKAVGLGKQILQEDPLREEVHRALMYCYFQMDQRTLAVRQFQLCNQQLMEELHILPMPATINLYCEIVQERLVHLDAHEKEPLSRELWAAFDAFQQAGERLNMLLDEQSWRRSAIPVLSDSL